MEWHGAQANEVIDCSQFTISVIVYSGLTLTLITAEFLRETKNNNFNFQSNVRYKNYASINKQKYVTWHYRTFENRVVKFWIGAINESL